MNLKFGHFLCIVALLLFSCCSDQNRGEDNSLGEGAQMQKKDSIIRNWPENFNWLLIGRIEKKNVTMHLVKSGSQLRGIYYSDSAAIPVWLTGDISQDGRLNVQESPEQELFTGGFKGVFTESGFEGYYKGNGEKDSIRFKLEQKPIDVKFSMSEYSRKKCQKIDRKNVPFCLQYSKADTMCSELYLNLLQVNLNDSSLSRKVNREIELLCCRESEKQFQSINQYLESIKLVQKNELLDRFTNSNLLYFGNGVISVGTRVIENNCGMHPWRYGSYLNMNLKDGNKISLEDLFNRGFETELQKIAVKQLGSEIENFIFGPETPLLSDEFAITAGGLLFTYDQYQFTSYPYGCPNLFIPYKEIEGLIPKDGLLYNLIRSKE